MILILALLLAGQAVGAPPSRAADPTDCRVDRTALRLGFDAFDQDISGGWRAILARPGCETAAADLIRDYRLNAEGSVRLLYWHEAQLRAEVGDTASAIPLMERSRETQDRDLFGWNAYVDATIAFLRRDRPALQDARARLAKVGKPADFALPGEWPPNLGVVDRLIDCFDRPYDVAYNLGCRK